MIVSFPQGPARPRQDPSPSTRRRPECRSNDTAPTVLRRRDHSALRQLDHPARRGPQSHVRVSTRRPRRPRTSSSASTSKSSAPAVSSSRSRRSPQGDAGRYYVGVVNARDRSGADPPDGARSRHLHDRRRLPEHNRAQGRRQDRHGLQGIDDAARPDQEAGRHGDASPPPPTRPARPRRLRQPTRRPALAAPSAHSRRRR